MDAINIKIVDCDYTDTDHLEAIGNLLNAYIADDMGGGEPLNPIQKLRLVDGLNQHPTSIVLLAQIDDAFCGLLIAFENFSTFTVSPMINIHDVIVLPEYRGNGVGKYLLESVIRKGKQQKASRVTLEVRKDNVAAQYLYKSLGFDETEPPMHYWRKTLK